MSEFIGCLSASYLLGRIVLALLRVRWARHAYPQVATTEAESEWTARCRGALLGLAIGDAVNLPAESLPRWLVRLRYPAGPKLRRGVVRIGRQAGDVSDDTQLAICVARSIDPDGTYRHERFVEELGCWSYFRIGAGRTTSRSAFRARRGRDRDAGSGQGNGVAIRIAPLALAMASRSAADLARVVEENGRSTHASELAIRAAVFTALVVRAALRHPLGAFARAGVLELVVERAAAIAGFDPGHGGLHGPNNGGRLPEQLRRVGTSGHVAHSIPAAILVLVHHRLDFVAAMRTVFRAGGDTDSIGSIVGTIIGAQIGADRLPRDWARGVQHRDYLCWLADRLATPRVASPRAGEVVTITGDVAARPVDVVVNAWNRNVIPPWLLVPQGVSKAIRRAGGRDAIAAVGRRAPLPLGSATETSGDRMRCRWVVHVAGIDLAWRGSEASVRDATRNALALSRWLGARTVAMPLIGSGSGGLGADRAEGIIRDELGRHREAFDRLELVRP